MKNFCLLAAVLCVCMSAKAYAMAVLDATNLVQNTLTALESMNQTAQQLQEYQKQLEQYQRQLQDAMNPGSWEWGDIQGVLDQLRDGMGRIEGMSGAAGNLDSYLGKFGDYDSYASKSSMYGTGSTQLLQGEYQGQKFQKESTDELLKLIKKQQEEMGQYAERLEALKSQASGAQGQQEAIQAGNEFASMQVQLLSQIHAVLLSQNTMLAAISARESDEIARKNEGSKLVTGTPTWAEQVMKQGHNPSYRQGFF